MGRSPGDRDGIVALHLIKKGIDAGDDLLVGNRFDGTGCERFDAVEAVGNEIVASRFAMPLVFFLALLVSSVEVVVCLLAICIPLALPCLT